MNRPITLGLALSLLAAAPAGAASTGLRAATRPSLVVTATDFRVALSKSSVPHGVPIAVTVRNQGKVQHEAIPEPTAAMDHALRYRGRVESIENVAPGRQKSGTWYFARPGVYKVACHVAGHYMAGMHATIRVA